MNEEFDYLLWYCKNHEAIKYRQLYQPKVAGTFASYKYAVNPRTLEYRPLSALEKTNPELIPSEFKIAQLSFAVSQDPGKPEERYYTYKGTKYDCGASRHWKTTNPEGLDRLAGANRLLGLGSN